MERVASYPDVDISKLASDAVNAYWKGREAGRSFQVLQKGPSTPALLRRVSARLSDNGKGQLLDFAMAVSPLAAGLIVLGSLNWVGGVDIWALMELPWLRLSIVAVPVLAALGALVMARQRQLGGWRRDIMARSGVVLGGGLATTALAAVVILAASDRVTSGERLGESLAVSQVQQAVAEAIRADRSGRVDAWMSSIDLHAGSPLWEPARDAGNTYVLGAAIGGRHLSAEIVPSGARLSWVGDESLPVSEIAFGTVSLAGDRMEFKSASGDRTLLLPDNIENLRAGELVVVSLDPTGEVIRAVVSVSGGA